MYLPRINAVSEGTWGLALVCIITGFVGPELWVSSPLGFQNNKLMLITFIAISAGTCFYNSRKILQKTDFQGYFLKIRFSIAFIVISWLIHACNPSFQDYTFMLVVLFNISKITILCQIAHISEREFQPIRFSNLAIIVMLLFCLLLSIFSKDISSIKHTVFALSALDFINFSVIISKRLAEMLAIRVFIVSKKSDQQGSTSTGLPEASVENQDFKKEINNESVPDENL